MAHYQLSFISTNFKTTNMIEDFASDLRVARRKSGLTQADCAHLMGKSAPKICQLETGKRSPSLRDICALSLIYGRSFESLFGAIFGSIRKELAENIATLRDPGPKWPGGFNRTNTLDRIAREILENDLRDKQQGHGTL